MRSTLIYGTVKNLQTMSARTSGRHTRKEVCRVYKNFRTPDWLKLLLAGVREKSRTLQNCRD